MGLMHLVGTNTRPRGAGAASAAGAPAAGGPMSCAAMASKYASVLPLPGCATASTSRPFAAAFHTLRRPAFEY